MEGVVFRLLGAVLVGIHHARQFVGEVLGRVFIAGAFYLEGPALLDDFHPVAGLPGPVVDEHVVAPFRRRVVQTRVGKHLLLLLDAFALLVCLADLVEVIEAEVLLAVQIGLHTVARLLSGSELSHPEACVCALVAVDRPGDRRRPHYA